MSRRSPNRGLITAGLIGVGVGVLAAGIGYSYVKARNERLSPSNRAAITGTSYTDPDDEEFQDMRAIEYPTRRGRVEQGNSQYFNDGSSDEDIEVQNVRAIEGSTRRGRAEQGNSQCQICRQSNSREPSITVGCSHTFHKKCLFSNYVVQTQMNGEQLFKCPVSNCRAPIPNRFVESLLGGH